MASLTAGAALEHRLFVPARRPGLWGAPLIVALHGSTQSAEDFEVATELDAAAERVGAYVLYPQQSFFANPIRAWNWFLPEHQLRGGGEPAAILSLVEEICEHHPIDRGRVFVAGLSAGAAMAAILAEQAPDVFAGAGIVAGLPLHASLNLQSAYALMRGDAVAVKAPPTSDSSGATRAHYARLRVSIWTGTEDRLVAPGNARVLAAQFRELMGIDASRVAVERRADATIERWRDGRGHVRIEVWRVEGMPHAWSGGNPYGSYTFPSGPSTSEELLNFFLPVSGVRRLLGRFSSA